MAKESAKGDLNLFSGLFASNLISTVGVLVIIRFLTPAEYGLCSVSLIPISVDYILREV